MEEFALHLHRLENWNGTGPLIGSVRFEHIGTIKGAKRPSIDRAYFRMAWERQGDSLQIVDQTLLEGERIFSEKPHFVNVAGQAGIDFKNQYYPPFLNEPMRFGMIRYGPGGITAVDYNNDGLCDLFIPDGVESKLFRNRGDGTFEDVTAQAGLAGLDGVSVGLFADYDNHGSKDFFVTRPCNPNQLYKTNRTGTLTQSLKRRAMGVH